MTVIRFILAVALISGFSVGSGFLTLTATVGLSGFWGGAIASVCIWLLGIASGHLYLEAFLAIPEANHIVTLCKSITGRVSTAFTSGIYLFFSYCTLIICFIFIFDLLYTAYVQYEGYPFLAPYLGSFILTVLLIALVYMGHLPTFFAIAVLFLIFLGSFGYDVYLSDAFSLPQTGVKTHFLFILFAIGAIFNVSFYQSVLPSLVIFLKRNRNWLLSAIWTGYTLAMLILVIWLWITLRPGTYANFLAVFESKSAPEEGFFVLQKLPQYKAIFHFLATFAVLISLLSVGISLKDFFEDAAKHWLSKNRLIKRALVTALIFFPSWLLSLVLTNHFVVFNTLVSTFCEFFLALVFPIQWVWSIRYRLFLAVKPVLCGGKTLLVIISFAAAILFFVIGIMPINAIY